MGWKLVSNKAECGGAELADWNIGDGRPLTFDVGYCADRCKGISTMFAFGTNDYSGNRCYPKNNYPNKGCNCLCETAAKADGTCTSTGHSGYRLYRYESGKIRGVESL